MEKDFHAVPIIICYCMYSFIFVCACFVYADNYIIIMCIDISRILLTFYFLNLSDIKHGHQKGKRTRPQE